MTVSLSHYLVLAAVLFTIGAVGVVVRRNALVVLMSIELMLNAANLTFLSFARFPVAAGVTAQTAMGGHVAAFFIIAVAAAEAAVGLAILLAVFRRRVTTHVDELTLLADPPAGAYDDEAAPGAHSAPAATSAPGTH